MTRIRNADRRVNPHVCKGLKPATIAPMNMAQANYAFDRQSARSFDADGRMRVRDCIISVAEVNPYYGREIPGSSRLGLEANGVYELYRDPVELERAAASFDGLPLMIRHVAQTADEPRKDYIGGSVFNARFSEGKLRADLLVMDKRAIEYIQSGELADLSSSYRYTPDMTAGEVDGRAYHGVMRNIEGNHVALVEDGRATGAHVADSALQSQPEETAMEEMLAKMAEALAKLTERLDALEAGRANDSDKDSEPDKADDSDKDEPDKADDSDKDEPDKADDSDKDEPDKADDSDKDDEPKAMDAASVKAAIDAAVAAERKRSADVETAKRSVRAVLGDTIAMDSADDIYRAALKQKGVDVTVIAAGTERIAWTAYQSAAAAAGPAHAMDRSTAAVKTPFDTSHIRVR